MSRRKKKKWWGNQGEIKKFQRCTLCEATTEESNVIRTYKGQPGTLIYITAQEK